MQRPCVGAVRAIFKLWVHKERYQSKTSRYEVCRKWSLTPCLVLCFCFFYSFSDEGVRMWLVYQLKALCGWTPPEGEEETRQVQLKVLSSKHTDFFASCSCASWKTCVRSFIHSPKNRSLLYIKLFITKSLHKNNIDLVNLSGHHETIFFPRMGDCAPRPPGI